VGSLNAVTLIGNLGRDAELRYTPGGVAVATFNMATTETWTDKQGQRQEKTEWHRIVLWGKAATALSDYLLKGKQLAVTGKLQTREWNDRDGVKRFTTEIKADRIVLLGGGQRRDNNGGGHVADEAVGSAADPAVQADEFGDSDIPF
jgi:single-strand DNA-binding protein